MFQDMAGDNQIDLAEQVRRNRVVKQATSPNGVDIFNRVYVNFSQICRSIIPRIFRL